MILAQLSSSMSVLLIMLDKKKKRIELSVLRILLKSCGQFLYLCSTVSVEHDCAVEGKMQIVRNSGALNSK